LIIVWIGWPKAASKRPWSTSYYLADALEAHVQRRAVGPEIVISDERAQLLETGGGLMHAQHLIDADPFLCVNSDNLWVDGPVNTLRLLASRWD